MKFFLDNFFFEKIFFSKKKFFFFKKKIKKKNFFYKKKTCPKRISQKNLSKNNKNSIMNKMGTNRQTDGQSDIAAYRVA